MVLRASTARRRALVILVSAAAAACISPPIAGHASTASADPYDGRTGTVQVSADVLRGLDTLTPTGVYDPTARLGIGVSLARPDPAGENAYLADVYNPASPDFRQFLGIADWQQRFGVVARPVRACLTLAERCAGRPRRRWRAAPSTSSPRARSARASRCSGDDDRHVLRQRRRTSTPTRRPPTVPADLGVLAVSGPAGLSPHMRTLACRSTDAAVAAVRSLQPASRGPGTRDQHRLDDTAGPLVDLRPARSIPPRGQASSMAIFGWGCTEPSEPPTDRPRPSSARAPTSSGRCAPTRRTTAFRRCRS